jgi:PKD repeat protein
MKRNLMMRRISTLAVFVMTAVTAACAITDTQPPPLAGPSEMALSVMLSANPDVLSLDGASQSRIDIETRDVNGQAAPNVPLRLEILADGVVTDFGALSTRTLVTGSNGRASFVYTAPSFVSGTIPVLVIGVTPTGNDAANLLRRSITIRLVPPGVIGNAPTPRFTFLPENPGAFTNVRFDGTTSTPGLGAAITSYVWDFGDGSSGTGAIATHQYEAPGTYLARLTVTDSNGFSATSATQPIVVGAGSVPTADFVFSPSGPKIGENVFFNGATSTAGSGHQIVRWEWNFGDGSTRSGVSVSKSYAAAGSYNVVLTVTDEAGQTAVASKTVLVGDAPATASFTFSPSTPRAGTTISFNASGSKGAGTPPNSITSYAWDFGCATGCTRSTGSGVTITNGYTTPGTYKVTLTITDSKNNKASITQDVTITP